MDLGLKNKNAIVCGSTQGIGEATAHALASEGVNITLVARDEKVLSSVLESLDRSLGQNHCFVCIDFSDENFPEKIQALDKSYDILINNTGGPAGGPILDAKPEAFLDAFKMHLINNQLLAAHVVQSMRKKNFGRIINIISTSVKAPIQGLGVSNTIRGAVASWSKTLANELGEFNITVNNVLPGATNTVRLQSIIETKASKTGRSIEDISNEMTNQVPMKRFAEAVEIANAISFLASPAASYINGINVPVDGGRTKSL